jgi:xylan 1,4-beta-xylosidase
MYSSYTAASFSREYELADKYRVNFEGALTWAFEFEDQPLFAGFRALASGGLDLAVLNVFRMFSRMSGQRACGRKRRHGAACDNAQRRRANEPDVPRWRALTPERAATSSHPLVVLAFTTTISPGPDADIHSPV